MRSPRLATSGRYQVADSARTERTRADNRIQSIMAMAVGLALGFICSSSALAAVDPADLGKVLRAGKHSKVEKWLKKGVFDPKEVTVPVEEKRLLGKVVPGVTREEQVRWVSPLLLAMALGDRQMSELLVSHGADAASSLEEYLTNLASASYPSSPDDMSPAVYGGLKALGAKPDKGRTLMRLGDRYDAFKMIFEIENPAQPLINELFLESCGAYEGARRDGLKVLGYLLGKNADINHQDGAGNTALHTVAGAEVKTTERLVEVDKSTHYEGNAYSSTHIRRTIYAPVEGPEEGQLEDKTAVIVFLLDNGVDKSIKNKAGRTAYEIVSPMRFHKEIAELLRPN